MRAKHHIELTISCESALEDGAAFFRTRSDAVLSPFPIVAQHIVSVVDTQKNQVLWMRKDAAGMASLTGEPGEAGTATSAASLTGEPTADTTTQLAPAQSKQPPMAPPSKRVHGPGHPPPSNKARKVLMTDAPKGMKFNILTDERALCGTIVVSGQKQCHLCGNVACRPRARAHQRSRLQGRR